MKKLIELMSKRLFEEEVINLLTDFDPSNHRQNINFFDGLLFDPLGYEGLEEYSGYFYTTLLERRELSLPRQGHKIVPGDIDVLFIPFNDKSIFYDRTAVWEVKIARPSFSKIKGPKSLGTTQTRG